MAPSYLLIDPRDELMNQCINAENRWKDGRVHENGLTGGYLTE